MSQFVFFLFVFLRIRLKQNRYPVMFLTQGITDKYPAYHDPRCQNVPVAVNFAVNMDILVGLMLKIWFSFCRCQKDVSNWKLTQAALCALEKIVVKTEYVTIRICVECTGPFLSILVVSYREIIIVSPCLFHRFYGISLHEDEKTTISQVNLLKFTDEVVLLTSRCSNGI